MGHCAPQTAEGHGSAYSYGIKIHTNGMLRDCGATTVVAGQSSVYVGGQLWAVDGDPNTHGGGNLIPSGSGVYIGGTPIIVHAADLATPDDLCAPPP